MHLRSVKHSAPHLCEAVLACARLPRKVAVVGVVILSLQARISLGSPAPDPMRSAQQALENLAEQVQNSLTNGELGTQPLSGFRSGMIPSDDVADPQVGMGPPQYAHDLCNWNSKDIAAFALAILLAGFLLYRMARSLFEGQLVFGQPVVAGPALSPEQRLTEEA